MCPKVYVCNQTMMLWRSIEHPYFVGKVINSFFPGPGQYSGPTSRCLYQWLALKILRMATNSLSGGAVHNLELWRSYKIIRVFTYMRSCMFRAASKTLSGYSPQHMELMSLAVDGLPIGSRSAYNFLHSQCPNPWPALLGAHVSVLCPEQVNTWCYSQSLEAELVQVFSRVSVGQRLCLIKTWPILGPPLCATMRFSNWNVYWVAIVWMI